MNTETARTTSQICYDLEQLLAGYTNGSVLLDILADLVGDMMWSYQAIQTNSSQLTASIARFDTMVAHGRNLDFDARIVAANTDSLTEAVTRHAMAVELLKQNMKVVVRLTGIEFQVLRSIIFG